MKIGQNCNRTNIALKLLFTSQIDSASQMAAKVGQVSSTTYP